MNWGEIWAIDSPVLISVKRVFMIKNHGSKISKVRDTLAKPETKVDTLAFEGMVVEEGNSYANIWQFRLDGETVEGRPIGGSRSGHKYIVDENGIKRRRKPGEWYTVDWIPKAAIDAVVKQV